MPPESYLVRPAHVPDKAAFPVIDAHNHLWGERDVDEIVRTMDAVGVVSYCDLTANARIAWAEGGYTLTAGDIGEFFSRVADAHPGRFYAFTLATFARPTSEPLFDDAERFAAETVKQLREHVAGGARGLKVLKELGLHHRDASGALVAVDDERLAPIWDEAGRLGVPVLIHQSDPVGFFQPVTGDNEHYESMKKFPSWSFADPRFPRKAELIRRRDNLVRSHPDTTFILPHVANFAEDLAYVSRLLDENPNVHVDLSARIDELGRQPYSAREFLIRYQDRVLFGTDMPAGGAESQRMYRTYF
ncbi:MAG: amidohydrolase family protein, partial [Planctomycetota bacterium]